MAFQKFRTDADVVQPNFAAEPLFPDHLIPGGGKVVASAFPKDDSVTVETKAATAVTAGSNKTVQFEEALSGKIPAGTILDFGSGEYVTFPTDVAEGATQATGCTVAADLEGGETATYLGMGRARIEAGTLLGRTYAERDAGTDFGPWALNDEEVYLLAFQIEDAAIDNDATFVRPQTLIKENWLPGWADYSADKKAALRKAYQVVRG